MTRNILWHLAAALIVGVTAMTGTTEPVRATEIFNIGTGGLGGIFWPTGGKVCDLVNKSRNTEGHAYRCVVESTAGSVGNLRALRRNDLDLGLAQADLQFHAFRGTSQFEEDGANEDLRFVMSFNTNMIQVFVRKDSGVDHIRDLSGLRVNTGNVGSGTEATAGRVFPYFGIDVDSDFALNSKLTLREQAQALCDNKIDAFFQPTAVGFAVGLQAANTCDVVIADVSGPELDALLADHPYYGRTTIPGGTYRGNPDDVNTFGFPVTLVAASRVPEDFVYQLLKAVYGNFGEFKRQHPAYELMTREFSAGFGRSVPYHPGAERYYREVGLIQ